MSLKWKVIQHFDRQKWSIFTVIGGAAWSFGEFLTWEAAIAAAESAAIGIPPPHMLGDRLVWDADKIKAWLATMPTGETSR